MKKISLKNILKKTFNNKIKKVKKKKKAKNAKTIKVKKIEKNLIKKNNVKKNTKPQKYIKSNIKENKKSDGLRISKSNEQKPEIKKIKKQETEKKEYKPKDYIVYPKHGIGQILSVSTKNIGGIEVQCYDIKFEKDKAIGLLPVNKQSHLRHLATINQVNKSISILKSKLIVKDNFLKKLMKEFYLSFKL